MTAGAAGMPSRALHHLLGRGVLLGTLWGVGVSAGEALVLPFGPLASTPELGPILRILLGWCVEGALLACATLAIEPWLDRWWKVLLWIAVAAFGVAAVDVLVWRLWDRLGLFTGLGWSGMSVLPYVLWIALLHGGLFILSCVFTSRARRTRQVLNEAQLARDKTEALLDKIEIEALYGQVEPAFLVHAMRAVRDRAVAGDTPGAERLLDEFVVFLRLAMPGVRRGRSTLAAELQLAAAYASLHRRIDARRAAWHVHADPALPTMPFPPLLLLPLLDALSAPGSGRALTLSASVQPGTQAVVLSIQTPAGAGHAAPVPQALEYRMRVALQATLGDAWQLTDTRGDGTTLPDSTVFELSIAARPGAGLAPPAGPEPAMAQRDTAVLLHNTPWPLTINPGAAP